MAFLLFKPSTLIYHSKTDRCSHTQRARKESRGALTCANVHGGGIVSLTWPGAASLGLRGAITGSVCTELCRVQLMWQPCYLLRHRVHIQQESTVWVCLRLCMCGYWVKISTATLTLLWKVYSLSLSLIHSRSFSLSCPNSLPPSLPCCFSNFRGTECKELA